MQRGLSAIAEQLVIGVTRIFFRLNGVKLSLKRLVLYFLTCIFYYTSHQVRYPDADRKLL